MTEKRETIVTTFKRTGHRTVVLMPDCAGCGRKARSTASTRSTAPRASFAGRTGWFAILDQFSLAFDTLEIAQPSRPPLFVFFPTISTHFPFIPTPPAQPDWARIFDAHPYDGPSIVRTRAAARLDTPRARLRKRDFVRLRNARRISTAARRS
jgi:hypothetical protein